MNTATTDSRTSTFLPRRDELLLAFAMALSPYALAWLALAVTQA